MKFPKLLLFAAFAFLLAAPILNAAPVDDAQILVRWITGLQFTNPKLPSYGALKIHTGAAATGAEGTPYYRVSPYVSNLGVLGLLRSLTPESKQTAQRWITWYFAHLNAESASDGVPFEHFYRADGSGETTCVQPNKPALCRYNDATDSAAATFFSVLWAAYQGGVDTNFLKAPGRKAQIEKLAAVLLKLQQDDGLCWAKADYRAKYLEDNCEVFAGLRDLAQLEKQLFANNERAMFYQKAAERVQTAIARELYDPQAKLYRIAKFEDGKLHNANLDTWYPDTQAQMWPHLWGVVAPDDARTQSVVQALNARWNGNAKPDWAAHPEALSGGWIEAGVAHAVLLAGDNARVHIYLQAVKRLKFPTTPQDSGFGWPFSIADAGWLVMTFSQIGAT